MAARIAVRYGSRRFSSGGKILSEEEKAAENVFIKKMEKDKMEKLSHKGEVSGGEKHPEVKPTPPPTSKVSTDKNRNYGVLAGTIAILSGIGWYYASRPKKTEQVQED
ncbi:F1F0-ATPase inhibitor protein [Zostera marina]|uniref:F1F0-ATPase inhibitor protein n=1 Tax=Zostera marina TaxID=29655 RepID=A0A0K9PWT6_ZOSMR|nr:F1F0-ATPase inhibitor protein [Zostera marina]